MLLNRSRGRRATGGRSPSSCHALVVQGLIVLAGLMSGAVMAGVSTTAFTYQGQLREFGEPVTATCDFEFALYDAETDGTLIGSANSLPGTPVQNGIFQVELDFGPNVFSGSDRWLSILVDCSGLAPLAELTPRQKITPAPLAQFAATAGSVLNPPATGWTISDNDIVTSLPGNVGCQATPTSTQ